MTMTPTNATVVSDERKNSNSTSVFLSRQPYCSTSLHGKLLVASARKFEVVCHQSISIGANELSISQGRSLEETNEAKVCTACIQMSGCHV